jgi:hypothetical protein
MSQHSPTSAAASPSHTTNKPQVLNLHRAVLIQTANPDNNNNNNKPMYSPRPAHHPPHLQSRHTVALTSSELYNAQQLKHADAMIVAAGSATGSPAYNVAGSFAEASNWIMSQSEVAKTIASVTASADSVTTLNSSGGGNAPLVDGDDLSTEDDFDSGVSTAAHSSIPSVLGPSSSALYYDENYDDQTTKRLKTFVTTTLHNERSYLLKIGKVLEFKRYLEENFNGSQTDLIVLFTGMNDIYKTHDIVASKLEDYLRSINELLSNSAALLGGSEAAAANRATSQTMKESFLSNALQLLANIMEISFPVYYDFLRNYSKAMTILDKLEKQAPTTINYKSATGGTKQKKSFLECKIDFFGKNITDRTLVQRQVEYSTSEFNN